LKYWNNYISFFNFFFWMVWIWNSFQSLLLARFGHWKILRLIQLFW
jgi:hypothetical protein